MKVPKIEIVQFNFWSNNKFKFEMGGRNETDIPNMIIVDLYYCFSFDFSPKTVKEYANHLWVSGLRTFS